MLPIGRLFRDVGAIVLLVSFVAVNGQAKGNSLATPIVVDGLGKGTIPLDGSWQFHLGDDMAWVNPALDDSHWEQLSADKPWGAQGHPAYTGFAWYRRRIQIKFTPSNVKNLALLIDQIDSCYEVYWNGLLVGRNGKVPPHPVWDVADPAQTFGLGEAADGVLALRIWRAPLLSSDSEKVGGPLRVPVLGTSAGISALKAQRDYEWLRARQYSFAQSTLYALVLLLSLIAWLRDPKERLLMWMSLFCVAPLIFLVDVGLHLRVSFRASEIWFLPAECMLSVSLWFLLLGLLELREDPYWARATRILAWIAVLSFGLDSVIVGGSWWANSQASGFLSPADWTLTAIYTLLDMYPLVLVVVAIRRRHGKQLNLSRWLVAIFACLSGLITISSLDLSQGQRFTHWTLADRLSAPLFSANGNEFTLQTISDSLLLLAILYALFNYTRETTRRQTALEQEYRNARAVQQVLIPEAIPQVPGFAIHSFYKPAGEVGGDFFQILATRDEGVLAVIGDVSGKGMPAAMTVSLLVGTVRTLAHYMQSPSEILAAMNQRMLGRSQGGFTTCLVLRADVDGTLTVANAGHIAPYLGGIELPLEDGLPLGLAAEAVYAESVFQLEPGKQLTLLTDGVVEAREKTGALFGFERTAALSNQPAEAIAAAAQRFGQEDDITIITIQRVAVGEESTQLGVEPMLAPS